MNPGVEIGAQAELRGVAPTGGSINSVGVTSAEYGAAASTFSAAFEVTFSGGASGTWYFFAGNGASFGASQSAGFVSAQVFTGLRFAYGASGTIATSNRNGATWTVTGISGTPFAQDTPYLVSIIGNNSVASVFYGTEDVPANRFDLWVNGILVGDDLAKGELANGTDINAFRFYGESSTGNVATISLDNIRWWNEAVPPSVSAYSTTSTLSAQTYSVLTMNSGDASLAGDAWVTELLTLNSGNLTLGASQLTLGANATVAGTPSATSMVVADGAGALCKAFDTPGSFTFPVGDATGTLEYSPATLSFASGAFTAGQACVRVIDAKHPHNPSTTDYLTRYWTVTASGISGFSCDTAFSYVDADIAGTEGNLYTGHWSGTSWALLDPADADSNTIGGLVSSFSDFTGGERDPLGITLVDFSAAQVGDATLVRWETASELQNRGFNLYRGTSAMGPDRRLNETLIPSQSPGNPGGFIYTWEDRADLAPGTTYYYWVEDVDIYGVATRHGPVNVNFGAPAAVTLNSMQAIPIAAGSVLPLATTLVALLTPLASAAAVRRRRL